jgi:acetylornithine deacetylase ArgE
VEDPVNLKSHAMIDHEKLLRDLVALPSVNPMGRPNPGPECFEHQVSDYLEKLFQALRVPCERQAVAPQRDNVVARWEPPGARRTLLLEVHQDTVPVDNMTIDPFGAKVDGGRLFGRGACDVKGGMAAMLAAFARLVNEKPARAARVVLACTVDEEFTFTGVTRLVQAGLKADFAVVAEPTKLAIVHAHKGAVRWRLSTAGRSCHSSSPEQGINAIYRMGRLLGGIEHFADRLRASRRDPVLGPPTLSVGRIEGGASVNTVPDHCHIEIDRRTIPGEDPRQAPGQLEAFLRGEGGIDFPFVCHAPSMITGALGPENSAELVTLLAASIDEVCGRHSITGVPYGTDASSIAAAGIPSVVFGPGDIAQAHTCDEWIALDEVAQASDILYRLACRVGGPEAAAR